MGPRSAPRTRAGRRIREIAFDNLHELTMDESAPERLDPPASSRLGEIAVPTLVLPADHDPPEMDPMSTAIAAAIPNARLVRIPDTDHVINVRRPEEFNDVVLGSWARSYLLLRVFLLLLRRGDDLVGEVGRHLLVVGECIVNAARPPVIERRSIE